MLKLNDVKTDGRGLGVVDFKDSANHHYCLHESSCRTSPAIFIRRDKLSEPVETDMFMEREKVQALVNHLQAWLDTGDFSLGQ